MRWEQLVDEPVRHAYQRMSGITPGRVRRWPAARLSEATWLACSDPTRMLDFLVCGPASDRKLRLFACACCRRIWHLLPAPACQEAVETAERYADELVGEEELAAARALGSKLADEYYTEEPDGTPGATRFMACTAAFAATVSDAPRRQPGLLNRYIPARTWAPASGAAASAAGATPEAEAAEEAAQCDLLRDIFGNPFRQVAMAPEWRSATVAGIARGIYQERAFDRLPILADALQDAGCADADILAHCHSSGGHVLGCWLVDWALGKK